MVDNDLKCWLIEVNASPSMDYSTNVTERLVKMVAEDTMKVVVDYYFAPYNRKWKIDTGLYDCIFRARQPVDRPHNSFNLNLTVAGKAISKKNLKKY